MSAITRVLGSVLVLSAVACASAPRAVPPQPPLAGEYVVEQVNGRPLPYKLRDYPPGHTELVSGGLTLRDDGTFTETGAVRLVVGDVSNTNTHAVTGRYTLVGDGLQLAYDRGGRVDTGKFEGGKLVVAAGPMTVTYQRK